MKLIFPNGEHGAVLLGEGANRLGSAELALIRLQSEGVRPEHCSLELSESALSLRLFDGAAVTVNGQAASDGQVLKPGDQIGFGPVQARLVAVERVSEAPAPKRPQVDDTGATRVRAALPKYVLRGVSGAAFGKTYAVASAQVIGRHHECDIAIASEEISRRHAQVKPSTDGLMVEDLGSSNGTYINGQRVQSGLLRNGDELRLDAIRFMLVVPGQEIPKTSASAPAARGDSGRRAAVAAAIVAAVILVGVVALFALR
ncbi:MAG: FHA domain-containing protein [Aquimonas sp.]|nr:FHA domain-containing protein [Aquimonas sp.]